MNIVGTIAGMLISSAAFAGIPEDITLLLKPQEDPAKNREVQDRLIAHGSKAIIPILSQWPTDSVVAANWLRTAIDDIAANNPKTIPVADLRVFVFDAKHAPKARRTALRLIEQVEPGATSTIIAGLLNDAEFSTDAIADLINAAEASAEAKTTKAILQKAYHAASNLEQVQVLAKKLASVDEHVNITTKLGLITQWHVVGPFPVSPVDGLKQSFAPEMKIDLQATYPGKTNQITWKAITTEADGKLDLIKAGCTLDQGNVAYATTTISVTAETKAQIRIGVVDNLTVWVNGNEVLKQASEYRSMFRPDRYQAMVPLTAGENVILMKFTKTQSDEGRPGAPPKWEAQTRLVQANRQGLSFTQAGGKR